MKQPIPDFKQTQYAFTAHIRDPENNKKPDDVEERRMAIYRELFFNNVMGFLESSFPVLKEVIEHNTENYWTQMGRSFFSTHRCHSPMFLDIPKEFLEYIENEHTQTESDPPFLYELAHYEWVELALSIAEDELNYNTINPNGNLLNGVPVISPLAWPLAYDYPVHQIRAEFQPTEPGEQATFLVVYRDRTDEIGFIEINAVTARLLELIADNDTNQTGKQLLEHIAQELGQADAASIITPGLKILNDMQAAGVILGTRK